MDKRYAMHQLMYLSSATKSFSVEDLSEILLKSRKSNSLSGVSGLLLYHDGSFLQILEGEEATIQKLYLKIMRDPRHSGFVTIFDKIKQHRDFAEWSMGFRNLSTTEWGQLSGFIDLNKRKEFLNELQSKSIELVTMINTFFVVNAR